MARVQLKAVVKEYGATRVVDGIDLSIGDGEFVVLLGPSGCGKTTTLRMVAGLDSITSGELWFDDRLMNGEPPDRREIGMVFQTYALYPHLSVADNLSFGLRSRRVGPRRAANREIRRQVGELAELLELDQLLDRRPKELSGGQRQRVALGRALIRHPVVFLMDEPLSNLDVNLRDRMRMELSRLHQRFPITTIYVTHDQSEALTLADRVVVMNDGRIRQVGTAAEVYDTPADAFVASFVGTPGMNLWTLPWARHDDRLQLGPAVELSTVLADQVVATAQGVPAGETVTIGVRPEHLRPVHELHDPALVVACRFDVPEYLGSHLLAHGRIADPTGHPIVAQLAAGRSIRPGEHLRLGARAEHLHLFSATTGERLPVPDRPRVSA